MKTRLSVMAAVTLALPAWAEAPKVAVDVVPLHGLVAQVMAGVGTPELILRQGASPHDYALRPSEAKALQEAEIVFHVGADLTPWLAEPMRTLAGDARVVAMMDLPGTVTHAFREGIAFEPHAAEKPGHGHAEHAHEEHAGHGHDDHAEHGHDAHAEHGHDDHAGHGHAGHDHAHDGVDPHGWMDPANAITWTRAIAETLAEIDPENAARYRENAVTGVAGIEAMAEEVAARLAPHKEAGFVVFHDAYQYFEAAFGLQAVAALSLSDAADPGAARVAAIRALIAERGVVCAFAEPQFNARLLRTVTEGTGARIAVLDPLGMQIVPGPEFYPQLIRDMATAITTCFEASS